MKQPKEITVILEGHNGFTRRMKWPSKDLSPMIKIPFFYMVKVSDPITADTMDLEISPVGEFMLYKRTKHFAWYKISNMYQVK